MTPTPIDTLAILRSAALEEGARLPADRVAQQAAYIDALEAENARLRAELQNTVTTAWDAVAERLALRDAVTVAIHACTDVTRPGRFAPSVNPVRWVAELEAHLRDAVKA